MKATKIFLLGLFYLVVSGSCAPKGKPAAGGDRAAKTLAVDVTPVRVQPVQRALEIVGSFVGNKTVAVSSEVDGTVSRIFVDVGDSVKKGQSLAQVDDREFRLVVEQAKGMYQSTLSKLGFETLPSAPIRPEDTAGVKRSEAQLDWAGLDYDRAKALFDQAAISQAELDRARTAFDTARAGYDSAMDDSQSLIAQLDSQKAQVELARKRLSDATITSPMDGVVSKRLVEVGQYLSAMRGSAVVAEVVDFVPIKMQGLVPERFAPAVKIGQKVEVTVDSAPGRTFEGAISRLTPDLNPQSRSVIIEATFANADRALRPGAFADASIVLSTNDSAVVVPNKAVVAYAGLYKVFVIKDGKAEERRVIRGVTVPPDGIEIVTGVNPGEAVAVSSVNSLYNGLAVTVKPTPGKSS